MYNNYRTVTLFTNIAGLVEYVDIDGIGRILPDQFKLMLKNKELEIADMRMNTSGNLEMSSKTMEVCLRKKIIPFEMDAGENLRIDKIIYEEYESTKYEELTKYIKEIYLSSHYDKTNSLLESLGGERVWTGDFGHPSYKFTGIQIKTMITNSWSFNRTLMWQGIDFDNWMLILDEDKLSTFTKIEKDDSDKEKLIKWVNKAKLLGLCEPGKVEIDIDKMKLNCYNIQSEKIIFPPVKILALKYVEQNLITKEIIIPDTVEILLGSIGGISYKRLKTLTFGKNVYNASISALLDIKAPKVDTGRMAKCINIHNKRRVIITPQLINTESNIKSIEIVEIKF